MRAAIISQGSKSSQWTAEAMKKYFDQVDLLDIKEMEVTLGAEAEVLYKGEPIIIYDCIYAKGSFRYGNLLRSITSLLYKDSFMPLQARAYTIAHNKLLTHLELQKNKIPMPKTYVSPTLDAARIILKKINYPIVMKFPEGTQGKGVMFADSYASASSLLDALGALKQPFIIQEFIESGNIDIRAFVVGDKVIASMMRKGESAELRANIHAGGEGKACELDRQAKKIAIDTAGALGAEVCGVDMLEGPKGPLVLEANISPGLQGITAATKIDVAAKIAKYLADKTKEFVASKKKIGAEKIVTEKIGKTDAKEIITTLDFRGERVLLPAVVSKILKFNDRDDYVIKAQKGKLNIEEFK
ncbi:MAG: RimK family alpha-L-glutamate ligase [Nanoarchaeota archaeon]|nr:RimK family alpha-L-glutamate ligase [Nanoarchaeota archaeon]